jgi:hypothetical protein
LGYNYYKEFEEIKKFQEFEEEESGAGIQEPGGSVSKNSPGACLAREADFRA